MQASAPASTFCTCGKRHLFLHVYLCFVFVFVFVLVFCIFICVLYLFCGGAQCRLVHLLQGSAETNTLNLPHWNARSPTLSAFKKKFFLFFLTFDNTDNCW